MTPFIAQMNKGYGKNNVRITERVLVLEFVSMSDTVKAVAVSSEDAAIMLIDPEYLEVDTPSPEMEAFFGA